MQSGLLKPIELATGRLQHTAVYVLDKTTYLKRTAVLSHQSM